MEAKAIVGLNHRTLDLAYFPLERGNFIKSGTYTFFVFIDNENNVHLNLKNYKPYKLEFDIKPMVYKEERVHEILAKGVYMNVKFAIINYGLHPCAYVEDIIGCSEYEDDKIKDIKVHGGFTFFGKGFWSDEGDETKYLGWDYAHLDDYVSNTVSYDCSKEWTTEEILEDVKDAIEQLKIIHEKETA